MKSPILLLAFVSSCFYQHGNPPGDGQNIVLSAPVSKQKQKVALLQKKLDVAEKEQKKVQSEVERLQKEVDEAQLAMIRKQIDSYEDQIRKLHSDPRKYAQLLQIESSSLFLKERETLYGMIQEGPSPSAFEAQIVLDRILRMITDLSNEGMR